MSSKDKESQLEDASDLSEEETEATEPQYVDDDHDDDVDQVQESEEHAVENVAGKKRKLDADDGPVKATSSSPRKKRKTSGSPALNDTRAAAKQNQEASENEDGDTNENAKRSAPKRRRRPKPKTATKPTKSSAEANQNRLVPTSQTQDPADDIDIVMHGDDGDDDVDGGGGGRRQSKPRGESEKEALHRERLLHCLTQQNGMPHCLTENDDEEDVMLGTDDDDDAEDDDQNAKLKREREIESVLALDDAKRIDTLHSLTLRRLCRKHDIDIYKHAQKNKNKNKNSKQQTAEKEYKSDATLVSALKEWRANYEQESAIASLRDVTDKEDIGNLSTKCLRRLGKKHHIAANQKVAELIAQLEHRFDHMEDEDSEDYICSLRDVHDTEEIRHLKRDTLVLLCNAHGINIADTKKNKTKKKKPKSKKKKHSKKNNNKKDKDDDDDDEEEEEDDDDANEEEEEEDCEEMIAALQQMKIAMMQRKQKKQSLGIEKLEDYQQGITQIHATEKFLSISGGSNGSPVASSKRTQHKNSNFAAPMSFKEDVSGLVALCNSLAAHKGQAQTWSITDDAVGPYSVVVSEDGSRTVKAMMVVSRGGRVVTKQWIEDSIQQQRWLPPFHYEQFEAWQEATLRARECNPNRSLLHACSVHVQQREQVGQKPTTEHVVHLLRAAGAHVVDREWNTQRITRTKTPNSKKDKDEEDGEADAKDEEEEEEVQSSKKNGSKKKKSSKRVSAQRSRKKIVKEKEDEDEDTEDEEQTKKQKKTSKRAKKKKDEEKSRMKIIISHPAMYNDLELSEQEKKEIAVVDAKWLFDCIEQYKMLATKQYEVKPKRQSKSPKY